MNYANKLHERKILPTLDTEFKKISIPKLVLGFSLFKRDVLNSVATRLSVEESDELWLPSCGAMQHFVAHFSTRPQSWDAGRSYLFSHRVLFIYLLRWRPFPSAMALLRLFSPFVSNISPGSSLRENNFTPNPSTPLTHTHSKEISAQKLNSVYRIT